MQTQFTPQQLADPATANAAGIIRKCVHCGFCTATCPTFLLTGDELDSPRGRIWLIKDMLEAGGPPSPAAVRHVDRCLGCLSCVTTCPSGVDYRQLVDTAREHIAEHHVRPWPERALRQLLSLVLTRPALFGAATRVGRLARPLAGAMPKPVAAMLAMVPAVAAPDAPLRAGVFPATGVRTGRVALHAGCVQPVLRPGIDAAAIRLLNRHGVEVVVAATGVCCGALDHHMGLADRARALAQANIAAWEAQLAAGDLDAILVTASGCGTVVKHYDELFAADADWRARARRIALLTRDVSEYLAALTLLPPTIAPGLPVAYHAACSLQHGQQVRSPPRNLLTACGFDVREIAESHICCGSAGTYSILQAEMAQALRLRKQAAIRATGAGIVVSGNIGCLEHLDSDELPTIHLVELLDWATGGPRPRAMSE
jgi:glycolate oxidase iron-sulfur subunit